MSSELLWSVSDVIPTKGESLIYAIRSVLLFPAAVATPFPLNWDGMLSTFLLTVLLDEADVLPHATSDKVKNAAAPARNHFFKSIMLNSPLFVTPTCLTARPALPRATHHGELIPPK